MNLYELLPDIINPDAKWLNAGGFTEENCNKLADDTDRNTFSVLKKIASLGVKYKNGNVQFSPTFVLADGSRTFSLEDLTDAEYTLLYSLELNQVPALLGVRIADILWIKKNDYIMAHLAVELSFKLYVINSATK